MAARQLSYYYGQPLVHCYLLHAEWLTLLLTEDPDSKDDADLWKPVIAAAIQASENAQAHLLSMQDHAPDSRTPRPSKANGANTKAKQALQSSPKAGSGPEFSSRWDGIALADDQQARRMLLGVTGIMAQLDASSSADRPLGTDSNSTASRPTCR